MAVLLNWLQHIVEFEDENPPIEMQQQRETHLKHQELTLLTSSWTAGIAAGWRSRRRGVAVPGWSGRGAGDPGWCGRGAGDPGWSGRASGVPARCGVRGRDGGGARPRETRAGEAARDGGGVGVRGVTGLVRSAVG